MRIRIFISVVVFTASIAAPSHALGKPPELLLRMPEGGGAGSGAGQVDNVRGVAVNRVTGHIFASDRFNNRIAEYTPWGEFVKAWGWGVDDGSAELQTCGPTEPEPDPPLALCQAGIEGEGSGQLDVPLGLAVDSSGNVYVLDQANRRVQKYDSEGEFVWMIGGDVNRTKVEGAAPEAERNICTAASGDFCQAGVVGAGAGQFGAWEDAGTFITAGPMLGATDTIYVGDIGRIQKFSPSGAYLGDVPDPDAVLSGAAVKSLSIDPSGDLFLTRGGQQEVVKIDQAGEEQCSAAAKAPSALATTAAGDVYVLVSSDATAVSSEVIELDSDCQPLIPAGSGFAATPKELELDTRIRATALATNVSCPNGSEPGDLYVGTFNIARTSAYVDAYGPTPECFEDPPQVPPQIVEQFATAVDPDGAVLKARINPNFWNDTRYYVEYGTAPCSAGSCASTQPSPPGSLLTSQVIRQVITTSGVLLTDLQPGVTYRYRFVAGSGGGGPVFGPGKGAEATFAAGGEGVFTTPLAPPPPKSDCPNQAFRSGPGARLPDCRAYEMVTPIDKGNGDVIPLSLRDGYPRGMEQSSLAGDGLAYASYRSFGGSASSPYVSEYVASRSASGWTTEGINAPREGTSYLVRSQFQPPFKALSTELNRAWLQHDTAPVLEAGIPAGFTNLYRRDNATGAFTALIRSTPNNLGDYTFTPEIQGVSADGGCAVFRANDKLATASAPAAPNLGNVFQLYLNCNGQTRLVSVLPSGTASTIGASAGTSNSEIDPDRSANVFGALSDDGARVYWTAASANEAIGPGALHIRVNAGQPQSAMSAGACTEPTKACTLLVSAGPAQFWQGAPDGSRALYVAGGKLFRYELATTSSAEVIGKVKGLLGASEDLSRVYVVSEEAFDGAAADKPNLYLVEGASKTFVGELGPKDVINEITPLDENPSRRNSRVSADGMHAAFMSTASLTGFDNADQGNGEPVWELFIYSVSTDDLLCVSCNPTGVRPSGREVKVNGLDAGLGAGIIPRWKTQLYAPRVLAEDGSRLFFESPEALVPTDSNGRMDVYEWSRADDAGSCEEIGAAVYAAAAGGCLSLLTSGQSVEDSEFVDADPSGENVFVRTGESLLPQDPGQIDIYDARVDGGLPGPPPAPAPCEGQACQSPAAAPQDPTPASQSYQGPGNVDEKSSKPRRCPKGKRKVKRGGKVRCVAKTKTKKAGSKGRAAR